MSYSMIDVNTALGKTDASSIAKNKTNNIQGKQTTDRGTLITKSGSEFSKNSFLQILSAQLSNLDPTANQDSTAYVTQMAQFAAMEQMYNLNDTMTTFAYQQLIGKGVTMDVVNDDGELYTGVIRGISKDDTGTHVSVEVNENGKNVYKVFDAKKIQTILDIPDYTGSSVNNILVNSDFLAASALKDQKVVISTYDDKDKNIIVKGTIKSVFIDNGVVKVRVETEDEDGKSIIKEYPYASIVKAGDLTESDMDVKPDNPPSTGEGEDGEGDDKTDVDKVNATEDNEEKSEVLKTVENGDGYKQDYSNEFEKLQQIMGK